MQVVTHHHGGLIPFFTDRFVVQSQNFDDTQQLGLLQVGGPSNLSSMKKSMNIFQTRVQSNASDVCHQLPWLRCPSF